MARPAHESPPDELVGRTVADGRYEILALLGQGGMGKVYRARERPLGRLVALKLIHRELAQQTDWLARFRRQLRTTAVLEHPHTVRLYDHGTIDGQPYFAMELLTGATLRTILEREGLVQPMRLVHVALQIARALSAAHAAGVVHRDLKPDNVMLLDVHGQRDFVKVLDFGITLPLPGEAEPDTEASGALTLAAPIYMSPEQLWARPLDARSDLYSLGALMYEMASGRPPFRASGFADLLRAHVEHAPAPLPRSVPAALAKLIMALLAKDPDARPQSAAAVIEALLAPSSPRGFRAGSRRGLFVRAGAALAILLGGGAVALVLAPRPPVATTSAAVVREAEEPPLPAACAADAPTVRAVELARAREKDAAKVALAAAERARALCPTAALVHQLRGRALQRLKRREDAERAYRRALSIAPSYGTPQFQLAQLLLERDDPLAALAALDPLVRSQPAYPELYVLRAEAHRRLGVHEEALSDLRENVRLHPRSAEGWALLGRALEPREPHAALEALCQARALGHASAPCVAGVGH